MRLIRFQAGDGEPRVGILSHDGEGGTGTVTVLSAPGSLAGLLALPLAEIREICASPAGETVPVAEVHLPPTLSPLFPGLPRRIEVDADTVSGALDRLEDSWPGLRDRLLESGPAIRPHIHVYVDKERAQLDTPVDSRSRVDVIAAISGG